MSCLSCCAVCSVALWCVVLCCGVCCTVLCGVVLCCVARKAKIKDKRYGEGKVLHIGDLKNPVCRRGKVEKVRTVKVESEGKDR